MEMCFIWGVLRFSTPPKKGEKNNVIFRQLETFERLLNNQLKIVIIIVDDNIFPTHILFRYFLLSTLFFHFFFVSMNFLHLQNSSLVFDKFWLLILMKKRCHGFFFFFLMTTNDMNFVREKNLVHSIGLMPCYSQDVS